MEAAATTLVTPEPSPKAVTFGIAYPERLSRGKLILKVLLGTFYVGIPHAIALTVYGIGVGVVTFIAFWVILFTGKYPRGMFDFVVGYLRWANRFTAYTYLMRDEYPPFHGRP